MNVNKLSLSRLFIRKSVVLTIVLIWVISQPIQVIHGNDDQCLQVVDELPANIVEEVVTVNPYTGEIVVPSQSTIPPTARFSRDRKYAVYWQMLDEATSTVGLHISSTEAEQPKLLYETTSADVLKAAYRLSLQEWSPDSRKFAYVGYENDQYFVAVVNADGSNERRDFLSFNRIKRPISSVQLFGWSADSMYLAASLNGPHEPTPERFEFPEKYELRVWTADLKEIPNDIILDAGSSDDYYAAGAWSPTGHRLAIQLYNVPKPTIYDDFSGVSLAVWSPEQGIESTLIDDKKTIRSLNHHSLYWSPDEQHLRLWQSHGHGVDDMIFGIKGEQVLRTPNDTKLYVGDGPEFVTWLSDGSALMMRNINFREDYTPIAQLYSLNINEGTNKVIAMDISEPTVSPDGRYLSYGIKDEIVKIIDLTTFQERTYYGSKSGMSLWSPNGQYVIFGEYRWAQYPENSDFIVDVETFEKTDLNAETARWLDEQWIVSVMKRNTEYHLTVRNLKTKTDYDLGKFDYENNRRDIVAALSPDKRYIVAALDDHTLVLYSFADRKSTEYRSDDGKLNFSASTIDFYNYPNITLSWVKYVFAWSPDSAKLAFVDGKYLVVIDYTGKVLLRIPFIGNIIPEFNGSIVWTSCN